MRVAKAFTNSTEVSYFPSARTTRLVLSRMPDAILGRALAEGRVHRTMTRADARRLFAEWRRL